MNIHSAIRNMFRLNMQFFSPNGQDKLRNTVSILSTTLLSEDVPKLLPARTLFVVTTLSLYLGGLIAHKGASYLEENEIFIPSDEDNDD
uniref:Essential MCU regulator, mitochondrial n=1 Tax=Heterorhabditis bacteriophora TaxID=37862 RepID=A0A1I7WXQ5_HETBA